MSKTITIRIEDALVRAIERRARASGTTVSEVVRDMLREGLVERPLAERIGHLKGSVRRSGRLDDRRSKLKERNWRA